MAYTTMYDAYGNKKDLRCGNIIETLEGDYKITGYSMYRKEITVVPVADYITGEQWYNVYRNPRYFTFEDILNGTIKFRGKGKLGVLPKVGVVSEEIWAF